MAKRPTITDVARTAGVGPATVDRVLNGRGNVRADTAHRVLAAAQKLGYHAAALIEQRIKADLPQVRFGIVLHKERQDFYQTFAVEMQRAIRAATGIRPRLELRFAQSQTPQDFITQMTDLQDKVDVLAASAISHPLVTDKVTELQRRGVPVFALLNDFAQGVRQNYVGLNNMKAGRIAGWMMAAKAPGGGKLGLFIGGHRWHGHELRETGFRSYFREHAPQFEILDAQPTLETRQLTYEATVGLLERHPDLRGIYVAGGGMEGAIAAVRELRRPGELALIVHELTPDSRAAMTEGFVTTVLCTPLPALCDRLVELMTSAALGQMADVSGQVFLPPDLLIPESI